MSSQSRRSAFSLVELLIVIAIIAMLIGILLPAVSRIRESGRSTACLANLQQWGYVYQMYLSANHGKSVQEWDSPDYRTPWQALEPYGKSSSAGLRCPSASEPKTLTLKPPDSSGQSGVRGSASRAWRWKNQLSDDIGSYGFNMALFNVTRRINGHDFYFHFPIKEPAAIPVFADSVELIILPTNGPPPTDLESSYNRGLSNCCIDRHRMAVNVDFLDGHAEHVPLPALFRLRWSTAYIPANVVIPGTWQ